MAKFLALVRDIADLAQAVGDDFLKKEITPTSVGALLTRAGDVVQQKLVRVVRESVSDPVMSEDDVLELTLEDFTGILATVIELHLTQGLSKNLVTLRGFTPWGKARANGASQHEPAAAVET